MRPRISAASGLHGKEQLLVLDRCGPDNRDFSDCNCDSGSYRAENPGEDVNPCFTCDEGKISGPGAVGEAGCTQCPAGKYEESRLYCTNCEPGTTSLDEWGECKPADGLPPVVEVTLQLIEEGDTCAQVSHSNTECESKPVDENAWYLDPVKQSTVTYTTELDRKEMGTTMCGAMQNAEYFNDTEVNDGEFSGDVPVKLPDSSSEFFLALEFAVDEAEVKGKTGLYDSQSFYLTSDGLGYENGCRRIMTPAECERESEKRGHEYIDCFTQSNENALCERRERKFGCYCEKGVENFRDECVFVNPRCDAGWTFSVDRCVKYFTDRKNWEQISGGACGQGANPALPKSAGDNEKFLTLFVDAGEHDREKQAYLGAHDSNYPSSDWEDAYGNKIDWDNAYDNWQYGNGGEQGLAGWYVNLESRGAVEPGVVLNLEKYNQYAYGEWSTKPIANHYQLTFFCEKPALFVDDDVINYDRGSLHLDENNYYTLCASDELQTCDPYSFAACEAAVPAGYVMHELRKDHTEDGFDKEPCAAEHENCQCTGYVKICSRKNNHCSDPIESSGTITCNHDTLEVDDPQWGAYKDCYCRSNFTKYGCYCENSENADSGGRCYYGFKDNWEPAKEFFLHQQVHDPENTFRPPG